MRAVKVQCIACRHSTRPQSPSPSDMQMLRAGYSACAIRPMPGAWVSVLWPRNCAQFSLSPEEAKRMAWLKKVFPYV
jgi:hypothetical protein